MKYKPGDQVLVWSHLDYWEPGHIMSKATDARGVWFVSFDSHPEHVFRRATSLLRTEREYTLFLLVQ